MEKRPDVIGFGRKSKRGRGINLSIIKEKVKEVTGYEARSGEDFVPLYIPLEPLMDLISEQKEYIIISHLYDQNQ